MEEQNNQNPENQEYESRELIKETEITEKKPSSPKKRNIIIIGAVFITAVIILLSFILFKHKHQWSEATCTTPKTCRTCGETEGGLLDHDFGAWIESVKGDCFTVETIRKRNCKDCDFYETETIPPSHAYSYGICTKCKKPIIDNITLPQSIRRYNATLRDKNHVSVYDVKWSDIRTLETPNTYHCIIGFAMYQFNYSSFVYANDNVNLKYEITDSTGNIVLEKTTYCTLRGGSVSSFGSYYSETTYFSFEFDITLDPNETYKFSIKILGGI